jgi:ABC-type antimicrobial peptide transport system permease subunit
MVPTNSSQQFDFVLSYELYKEKYPSVVDWGNESSSAYVILKPGTNIDQFNKKIADYVKTKTNNNATHRTPFVKRYSEKYLYGKYENGVQTGGRIEYVQLFSIIAIVILVIACINFMNLSTAKASRRLKEVGVKKALGASRKTLIFQYLGESMFLILLSLITAILLVILFLPHFNQITDKQLTLSFNLNIILAVTGISLLTGLLAGSYPALYLSGFNPIIILKGKLPASAGEIWTRQGLVVFQFVLSVIFIVSVLVVYKQIQLIQTKNLGYDRNNIIWFSKEGKLTEQKSLETFLSEIKNLPGVVNASSIRHNMAGHVWGTSGLVWAGKSPEDNTEFEIIPVSYDMLETLGIKLKEGRTFSKEYGADSSKVILNEAALALMEYKEPIGKTIKFFGEDRQIIGVARNFHFESLHETIKPLVFICEPARTDKVMVKIQGGREPETLYKLQKFYQEYNPSFVFEYKFLDQDYQTQYVAEKRVGVLSKYFASLAILISCLGLFGLASFTAERRRKEIGVRKVLGASRFSIVYLLSSDFTKLVVIAISISLPLSYLLVKNWLNNFEYRIDLQWWYFVGSGLAALVIAWLTVSTQAVKAASVNPVHILKDE